MKQLTLELLPPPAPSLDNFFPGRNLELLDSLRGFLSDQPGERFIYVWGPSGSGRTHLLRACVNHAGGDALFMTAEDASTLGGVDELLTTRSLVAVDGADQLSDQGQAVLFNLYNELKETTGRLIVSGDAPPAQLALRPDLSTRLGWGLVYGLTALNDEEKMSALTAHAAARGMPVSPDVVGYLLRHWRRDLPSLLGALDALDHYSLASKRSVTVPLLKEILPI